jgi:hypothetical protein
VSHATSTEATGRRGLRAGHYKWVALSNTTLGMLAATVNSSIVIIALPAIFRGIKLNPLQASNISYLLWMLMGYLVVSAVLVVTLGRLGDIYGRVRMYNAGFAIFGLAALALPFDPFTGPAGTARAHRGTPSPPLPTRGAADRQDVLSATDLRAVPPRPGDRVQHGDGPAPHRGRSVGAAWWPVRLRGTARRRFGHRRGIRERRGQPRRSVRCIRARPAGRRRHPACPRRSQPDRSQLCIR